MPGDVVDGEPSPHQVQLVTEIACEYLMHAIIEVWSTLRLMCFEGAKGCEGALSGFSGALIVWVALAPTSTPATSRLSARQKSRAARSHSPSYPQNASAAG